MINSPESVATLCEYQGIRKLMADVLKFQTLVAKRGKDEIMAQRL